MLKNAEIQNYLRQLQEQAAAGRVADLEEIKAIWTETLRDTSEKTSNRLRAGELLARAAGAFLHFRPDPDSGGGIIATGEVDGGDVVIYVPQMLREEDCQWKEDETP